MTQALQAPMNPNQPIWLGEGRSGNWTDYDEMMHDCELDFGVIDAAIETRMSNDPSPTHKAVVNATTQKIIGIVSERYVSIENSVAFKPMRELFAHGAIGIAGGMSKTGLAFMVCRLDDRIILGEHFAVDVVATNSFNGRYSASIMVVPRRIVCNNQFAGLMKANDSAMFRIPHTAGAERRINSLNLMPFVFASSFMRSFDQVLSKSGNKSLSVKDAKLIVENYIYNTIDPNITQAQKDLRTVKAQDWMDVYYDSDLNKAFRGTKFGFLNAYMDFISHAPSKPGLLMSRAFTGDVNRKPIMVALGW